MAYSNPVADTSIEVLRIPIPVQVADLAGNSFTLSSAGGIPVTPTGGTSLSGNTGLPTSLPAIVQKAKNVTAASGTTIAATFASGVTAGNSIIVVTGAGNNGTLTVADTLLNTYTSAVVQANSTTFEAQIFYAVNIAGGANVVTVTNGGSAASMAVQAYEVSGLIAQAGALGQNSGGTGTSATPSINNIAAGSPNSLAFMGVAVGTAAQAASVTAGTNWLLDSTQNSGGTPSGLFTFGSFNQPLDNIGPVAPKCTIAGSEPFALVAAIFKPVVLGITGSVSISGYNYTRITTAATALAVKAGPGVLHAVIVNTRVASGTIECDDAVSHTNPMGIITFPGTLLSDGPIQVQYDVNFTTGLNITTTGTMDITIVWR